ncbi:MAG TPA: A/G-specific adenine glycosylase [Sphingomicrobium sp.]
MMSANAARRLIQHYVDNYRRLPWREPPGSDSPDPYRVWLSEIMLQQTTVATVIPRFERFVTRWPTVEALAAARDEDVLSEWAGLGYYARARNLIACARMVAALGGFPASEAGLRTLPGIGAYTAAAIAAIAFGERTAVIDTNVTRVIARLHGLKVADAAQIRSLVDAMTPADRPGDFAQGMMDLGATVCRPRRPNCAACPLQPDCAAFASGQPETFPEPKAKKGRPQRFGTAYWTEREGRVWLIRRPASGLLGGMAALPSSEWSEDHARPNNPAATIRHVFTHFALELDVVRSADPVDEGRWHPIDRLAEAGLPTLFAKAAEAMLEQDDRLAA